MTTVSRYPTRLSDLRDAIYDACIAERDIGELAFEEFEIRKAYRPLLIRKDMEVATPVLTIMILASDEIRQLRDSTRDSDLQIQFAIQCSILNADNEEEQDRLIKLKEQIDEILATDFNRSRIYHYIGNETLRDESNLPYNLGSLREFSFFEVVSTATYKIIIPPEV